jgi:glycogen phosphorylase
MRPVHTFNVVPSLPPAIESLRDIAYNLRWCWSHESVELFRRLDSDLWEKAGHNPVLLLGTIEQAKLEVAACDDAFLAHLQRVESNLATYLIGDSTWFRRKYAESSDAPLIAYFSAEFGLTECLSIFAGGLGILAGDHLKSASDLGVPLVGVGLLYQQGYFRQYLSQSGWQQESFVDNDFHNLPVTLERHSDGSPVMIEVDLAGSRCTRKCGQCKLEESRSTCSTPTYRSTHAPTTATLPTSFTVATARCASGRRFCWAWAAIAHYGQLVSSPRFTT